MHFLVLLGLALTCFSCFAQINQPQEDYPWMVRFMIEDPMGRVFWMYWCGGSLITREHVLTSAGCVKDIRMKERDSGRELPGKIHSLRIGTHDKRTKLQLKTGDRDFKRKSNQLFYPKEIFVHEDYDAANRVNDIAIIRLSQLLNVTRFVNFIDLIPNTQLHNSFVGEWTIVPVWTEPIYLEDTSTELLTMRMKIRNSLVCQVTLKQFSVPNYLEANKNLSCATIGPVDACQSRPGSAMVYYPDKGKPFQIGLASFALDCVVPPLPAFYTRVSPYLHWIDSKMKGDHIRG